MSRRKTFAHGQQVEVQREPSAAWEPASYDKPQPGRAGYHLANLPSTAAPRRITMPPSLRIADQLVHWISVPAQRIRATKVKSAAVTASAGSELPAELLPDAIAVHLQRRAKS